MRATRSVPACVGNPPAWLPVASTFPAVSSRNPVSLSDCTSPMKVPDACSSRSSVITTRSPFAAMSGGTPGAVAADGLEVEADRGSTPGSEAGVPGRDHARTSPRSKRHSDPTRRAGNPFLSSRYTCFGWTRSSFATSTVVRSADAESC